jgi:hypothetical protein
MKKPTLPRFWQLKAKLRAWLRGAKNTKTITICTETVANLWEVPYDDILYEYRKTNSHYKELCVNQAKHIESLRFILKNHLKLFDSYLYITNGVEICEAETLYRQGVKDTLTLLTEKGLL